MSTESQKPPSTSAAARIAAQLGSRLDGHTTSGDAFVVSIYGEWGIGKTRCLRDIMSVFEESLDKTVKSLGAGDVKGQIVVPVFFDPWQYEHEEHLVIPLLKTIEQSLRKVADRIDLATLKGPPVAAVTARSRLHYAAGVFGDVAVALLSGFKFKFAPLAAVIGFDAEFAPKDAIEAVRKAAEKRKAWELPSKPVPWYRRLIGQPDAHDRLVERESLYFDVRTRLATLTETKDSTPALRIVVLVDDLDRCLPEKAIQILESVKLFLNVAGFSFVLAVDDEVVERGIAHRYRAYVPGDSTPSMNAPISGAEYLEKVVHLPVHLQRWTREEAAEFLRLTYPTLFAAAKAADGVSGGAREVTSSTGLGSKSAAPNADRAGDLLKLVLDAIPLVPRKLIRLAEALEFQRLHIFELQAMELWQPLHAARVVALQQLYPGLYRHLRLRASRYWRLFRLRRDDFGESTIETGESFHELKKQFDERRRAQPERTTRSQTDTMRENLTLLGLVEEAGHQRGNPDPLGLFPMDTPETDRSPDGIRKGLTFEDFAQLYLHGLRLAPAPPAPRKTLEPTAERVASVADPRALRERLLDGDTLGRREYLQATRLDGRLPDDFYQSLLDELQSNRDRLTDIEWLRDMAELTSAEQLLRLYQDSKVLEAWLAQAGRVQEHAT